MPDKIVAATDIPRARSGNTTELAVRDVVHGRAIKNKEVPANPEPLELFRSPPRLVDTRASRARSLVLPLLEAQEHIVK